MRHSMKPISSPGRTDKLPPPPLMGFLKGNLGSKSSRGRRCRSSPLFFRRKASVIEPTQEPSSPKVTCIGQVRVRRSSTRNPPPGDVPCSCMWVKKALSWFSPFGYCSRGNPKGEISPIEPPPELIRAPPPAPAPAMRRSSSSPPKNAFLLTRCRSAPYRSSSLASRFLNADIDDSITQTPESGMATKSSAEDGEETVGEKEEETVQPLILTRSKSEPARTGERINPDLGLLRQRRLGFSADRL